MGLELINAEMFKNMIIAGANLLEKNKDYVDELNVFPVPDGDTGTNMSLTVVAAAKEVQKTTSGKICDIAKALSSGSLRGARGNSGVILSQLFRGLYNGLKDVEDGIDTTALANAFQKGVETAYKAVMKPKEGTILTVAREGAEKAMQLAIESNDVEYVLDNTISYAIEVLDKTPDMLPVLKQAGVVDAGGQGLIFILQGALNALQGQDDGELADSMINTSKPSSDIPNMDLGDIEFGYCTEFIVNCEKEAEESKLKTYFESIGDSVVVVCDDDIIKVHVHTNNPGNAIQKGLEYGQLADIKVDNMRLQHANKLDISFDDKKSETKSEPPKEIGFISVSIGEGLSQIFEGLGVDYLIEGGQTMNPSTEDILNAIKQVNAKNIIILPNNKNIILAAEQAKQLCEDKRIEVIPSKSIPQGIGAMINYDCAETIDTNVKAMSESLEWIKTGQITYAVRDTSIEDKEIKKDDILGIGDSKILVVNKDIDDCTKKLLDELIDEDSELITIYYGQDVDEEKAEAISDYVEKNYEDCEVEVHNGGQPLYYYIFSVE